MNKNIVENCGWPIYEEKKEKQKKNMELIGFIINNKKDKKSTVDT